MNFQALLSLLMQAEFTYQSGVATLDAGGTAATPSIQVGTRGGKPLFAHIVFSESKNS